MEGAVIIDDEGFEVVERLNEWERLKTGHGECSREGVSQPEIGARHRGRRRA
jgi:hypothetical protein